MQSVVRLDEGVDGSLKTLIAAEVRMVSGSVSSKAASEAVASFEAPDGDKAPLLLCSTLTGGRGLNLPSASSMYFIDAVQSARVYEQCVARALRRTRCPELPLSICIVVSLQTIDHGHHQAVWARAALGEALVAALPSEAADARPHRRQRTDASRSRKAAVAVGSEANPVTRLDDKTKLLENRWFGVRWRAVAEPPLEGHDLTESLPKVVAALCDGQRLFDADEWESMAEGRHLSTEDFVVLDSGTRFAVPCCSAGAHVSSALAELATAYTFGQDGGTSAHSALEHPWEPCAASHEAFEALMAALTDERLAERRRFGREKRLAAKEEARRCGDAFVLGQDHTTRSGASFSRPDVRAQPLLLAGRRTRRGTRNALEAQASSVSGGSGGAPSCTSTAVEPPDFVVAPLTRPGSSRELRGMYVCVPYEGQSGDWTRYFGVVADVSDALQEVHITFPYQVHLGNDDCSARCQMHDINSKFSYLVPQHVAFQQWNGWRPALKTQPQPRSLRATSSAEADDVSDASDATDASDAARSASDASDASFELDLDEADIAEDDRRQYDALIHDINLANWGCARSPQTRCSLSGSLSLGTPTCSLAYSLLVCVLTTVP